VVVRRRGRSSYSSYGIKTTPKKIQIKEKKGENMVFFFFFFLQWRWQLAKQKRRRGPTNKIK
jgi:hypothetical protein